MQDQEKIAHQQKTAREAEQEKQWKQLQALRQQQAQQQQHVIHEQRVQGKFQNILYFMIMHRFILYLKKAYFFFICSVPAL